MSDDREMAAHYDDPANREPAGDPVRRSTGGRMTEHVAIRFSRSTVERVKQLADEDGQTVSAWIRSVVDREVDRLLPETPVTSAFVWEGIRTSSGDRRLNVVVVAPRTGEDVSMSEPEALEAVG